MTRMMVLCGVLVVAIVTPAAQDVAQPAPQPAQAASVDRELFLQILLDRAGFSPGEIDGRRGANTNKAMAAFVRARALPPEADVDAIVEALDVARTPVLTTYEITADDVEGPFVRAIPRDMMAMSRLPALHYTSVIEALGERFHASPALLRRLNPGAQFAAGETIQVPNVLPVPQQLEPVPGAIITVSKGSSALTVSDGTGQVILHAPVTSGSEHDPLPIGEWTVTSITSNPVFNYNPALFWDANPSHAKAMIRPGPNNPVGVVWIGLSKEHYGIHGTPEPSRIGYTTSHGCVRLTNWDASRVAAMITKGTRVIFTQ